MASSGQLVKLIRQLDWLVVADHAESLGVAVLIERADPALLASDIGKQTYDYYMKGDVLKAFETWGFNVIVKGNNPLKDPNLTRTVWEEIVEYAEEYNDPGVFTAFIGYEWSAAPGGNNLHRVVISRDGAEEAKQVLPFPAYDSSNPEDLWRWMENYEKTTGGEVLAIPHKGKAPRLMVRALRDPDGANLDRVQVIKGWLDAAGAVQERIYDAACSDERKISQRRCEKPVGNTVDVSKASYTNDIGDPLLMAYWEDPEFDPSSRAFYYVRVLEIPTPRWTTYDAAFYGLQLPGGVPASQQGRAYTSPIWYTP